MIWGRDKHDFFLCSIPVDIFIRDARWSPCGGRTGAHELDLTASFHIALHFHYAGVSVALIFGICMGWAVAHCLGGTCLSHPSAWLAKPGNGRGTGNGKQEMGNKKLGTQPTLC